MRIALVVLFLLCGVGVFAESRPPQPIPPQKTTATLQQNTDAKHDGTEQSPLVVKILPSEKSKDEAANDTKEKEDKAFNDKMLVIFTFGLVAVGVMQLVVFGLQARRLSQTVKATEKAVKSAQDSERPYIFVTVDLKFEGGGLPILCNGGYRGKFSAIPKNHGKTSGILTKVYAREVISDICPTDLIETPDTIMPPGIAIGSGECGPCEISFNISADSYEKIKKYETKWFFYGRIEYVDIFGNDQKTGFCWEFIQEKGYVGLKVSNNKELNYYT